MKGIYRHFKGNLYEVIGIANHSETRELMVVYKPLYEHDGEEFCVRPIEMFNDEVERDGYKGPRFKLIEERN